MTTTRETEEEGEGGMVNRRESASAEKSEFSEVKEKGYSLKLYHILCNSEHQSCTCACVCFKSLNEHQYTFIHTETTVSVIIFSFTYIQYVDYGTYL